MNICRQWHAHHPLPLSLSLMNRSVKVAVIGAGVSGLSAARELQREGHRVVVFEKQHRIGGTWVYDLRTDSDPLSVDPNREIVPSSLYLSLRTNLPRQLMGFLDYPFSKEETGDPRTFPGHEEVLRFLDKFEDEFGLRSLTRLNTEVVRVERVNRHWVVESRTQSFASVSQEREVFEAVVICTGHFTEPIIVKIPGIEMWPGFQMHSHNYRVPEPFQDQIVVIIGLGPSGFDISRDVAPIAKEVHIAAKIPDGMDYNLENRDNIFYHPVIKQVYEDGMVAFEDGSSIHANAMIYCTGYAYHFPFLETNGIVSVEERWVRPLYKHVFPPALAPSLSFIGLPDLEYTFQIIELQSKWVAQVLSGKVHLPMEEEMMISVQKDYQQLEEKGVPKHHTHSLIPFQADYKHWLAAQCGLAPLEDWRENMFAECLKKFAEMQDKFRDQWDEVYWDAITHS
ncbi:hypothetical protein L6164_023100 [Bauhinia variegata]|uniref:Uncharacterized protein n=1 Tax=Bauhinia variegata TaxID=167791 RepID=A0ACB9MH80_BAUVA|nr:hypothetical protein L6164_023100 [Bauhinia variegata]